MRDVLQHRLATLVVSATAVLVAATDTYVVVLALPDMMSGVGISVDQLQRAAPIVTVFLLGYVAMLPLLGKLSDIYGRARLLIVLLGIFAFGSMLTAVATDLTGMVTGRFLQGVGGGGLVPVTLALVADLWDERRRGLPLGVVGAVQELGAVLGPVVGAAVLAVADWRAIFWLNTGAGVVLAAALVGVSGRAADAPATTGTPSGEPSVATSGPSAEVGRLRSDPWGVTILACAAALLLLALVRPVRLQTDVTWGWFFVPLVDGVTATSPLWLLVVASLLAFVVVEGRVRRPLLDVSGLWRTLVAADLLGGLLIAVALGAVILAFATADPAVQLASDSWPLLLAVSALSGVAFVIRQRRAASPLVPPGTLAAPAAWGSLLVSFFVGAALVAVLVDVPVYARIVLPDASQWDAATLLLRFLVALPVGALFGGFLLRRVTPAPLATGGMAAAAAALAIMSTWDASSVAGVGDDLVLLVAGLGFGMAVAPVNAALLSAVQASAHGVGSSMLVVSRMVGMLLGLSALTAVALRRFTTEVAALPPPDEVCPESLVCPEYSELLGDAVLTQVTTTFVGAAVCAAAAALLSMVLLRRPAPA